MWRVVLAVALALVADVRPASACICPGIFAIVSPRDGATDVPRNAIVIARYDSGAGRIVVRDAVGIEVPTRLDVQPARRPSTMVFAVPLSPLAANTTYTAVLEDELRSDAVVTFATGDDEDHIPPTFAGISSFTPETMKYPIESCISSCVVEPLSGQISRIDLGFPELPPDAAHAAVRIRGPGASEELPLSLYEPHRLGFETCDTSSPPLDPGGEYCASIVIYDSAGNRAGENVEICAAAASCKPLARGVDFPRNCEPTDECVPIESGPGGDGCAVVHGNGWWLALAMTAMSWICARRSRRRRLDA